MQVSRTHLVQLLDAGRIPRRMVVSHRRARTGDILALRREALDKLTARDQELGLQWPMPFRRRCSTPMSSIRPGFATCPLRLADRYLHVPLWSGDIHAEWMPGLLADRSEVEADVSDRTRAVMHGHVPGAIATDCDALAAALDPPDPDDRHVPAAPASS